MTANPYTPLIYIPPTTTPFTRFLPKQRPDSGRLTYTGGLCMDCLNAVICHFSLYNSATICCVFLSRCVDALELAAWELVPFLFFCEIFGLLSLSPVICKIPEKLENAISSILNIKKSAFFYDNVYWLSFFYQKLENGPRVGKCPGPGQHKICKCPTPGTVKVGKCPAVAWKGHWAQLELTDALDAANCTFLKLLMNNQ